MYISIIVNTKLRNKKPASKLPGGNLDAGIVERTYRIFVEQLNIHMVCLQPVLSFLDLLLYVLSYLLVESLLLVELVPLFLGHRLQLNRDHAVPHGCVQSVPLVLAQLDRPVYDLCHDVSLQALVIHTVERDCG